MTMVEILAASRVDEWRRLDPSRTVLMDLDRGQVVFELAPTFAPELLRNLRTLVREGWFDGLSINRVQDNFVTQWGDAAGGRPLGAAAVRVTPEFERDWSTELRFTPLPDGDVFAPQVGFVDGFPVAGDRAAGRIWMTHCYGALGVGRDAPADSGNGSELYVVIGHAPRQLDRNITVVGRVVMGAELLAALPRGTQALGFYATAAERVPIRRVRFADDLPPDERPEADRPLQRTLAGAQGSRRTLTQGSTVWRSTSPRAKRSKPRLMSSSAIDPDNRRSTGRRPA